MRGLDGRGFATREVTAVLSRLLEGLVGVALLLVGAGLLSCWYLSRLRARQFAQQVDALWPDSRSGERDWIAQSLAALEEADSGSAAVVVHGAVNGCGVLAPLPAPRSPSL
ncbi:hypothetical protein [Streptacidiphilus anmyonensis]|uniref:hypothetical protein n=1 Tax=Streptacidiphilus anmyonensis TaxID=405782 RepID=UPI0005A63333|nr:hypothetical protein [Streptacidiphilus anmyonensis]